MTAATDIGFIETRISKVVWLAPAEDETYEYGVLDEVSGDRHLLIQIGHAEAFSLAVSLNGMQRGRPMTYQFMAALLQSTGGRRRTGGSMKHWLPDRSTCKGLVFGGTLLFSAG